MALQLDDKLIFKLYISNICRSAANRLNALIRLKKFMNFEEKKNFDKQLFYGKPQLLLFSLDAIQCKFTEKNQKFTEKSTKVLM